MHRIAVLVLFLAGCAPPDIESYCNATEDGVECSFTNMGGTGSTCVNIILERKDGKKSTSTVSPLCSGEIGKMQTVAVWGEFGDPQPGEVCLNEDGGLSWDECELRVKPIE